MTSAPALVCRCCGEILRHSLVDLGEHPLANSYLEPNADLDGEPKYALHARVCAHCFLVQVDSVVAPHDIFSDYAYFSSYSDSWLSHARSFANLAAQRLGLGVEDLVFEVASNDGYLLRFFAELGYQVLGVEPAANVAAVANAAGIPTEVRFFGLAAAQDLRRRGVRPSLIVANNVLAHVPDLMDFLAGLGHLCGTDTTISIEVPHLLNLIQGVQFDTIYHEHFSYFSLLAAEFAMARAGLRVFDVERILTHGGSLRLWVCLHDSPRKVSPRVAALRIQEAEAGLARMSTYEGFAPRVEQCRSSLLGFLQDASARGRRVVAYGAAAKGNTLLNYCGVTPTQIPYVLDRSPHKQGRLLPGSHLPVEPPSRVYQDRPEYLLILPWNLQDEICEQMAGVREWGGQFVIPVPSVRVRP